MCMGSRETMLCMKKSYNGVLCIFLRFQEQRSNDLLSAAVIPCFTIKVVFFSFFFFLNGRYFEIDPCQSCPEKDESIPEQKPFIKFKIVNVETCGSKVNIGL